VAFASVDAKPVLHATPSAVRRGVIAQARALPFDSRLQHVLDRTCQPGELVLVERPGGTQRVDLRAPERLVDVDVPEPRDCALVEERGLDGCASPFELSAETASGERAVEWLRPQALLEVGLQLADLEQLPRAEAPNVSIRDVRSVVQVDNSPSMRIVGQRSSRRVSKASRHPEVNQQSAPRLEPNDQILAATVERGNLLALELGGDSDGLEWTHKARIVDLDAVEPPPDEVRLELLSSRLDLG